MMVFEKNLWGVLGVLTENNLKMVKKNWVERWCGEIVVGKKLFDVLWIKEG